MEKDRVLQAVRNLKKNFKKRNFTQTLDLIVNLQNIDLKNPQQKLDVFVKLSTPIKPKPLKICAVVDSTVEGYESYDKVMSSSELQELKGDMSKVRKVVHSFDKFVVQVSYMPTFVQILGRYLGPLGKMPSPKLGMIVTPKTQLEDLYSSLQRTVHIQTRKNLVLQASVGSEDLEDLEITQNVSQVLNALENALPNNYHNIKSVSLKTTMGEIVGV